MAFRITSTISRSPIRGNVNEYICSEEADIDKLPRVGVPGTQTDANSKTDNAPCWYGSIAILCTGNNTTVYTLTPNNVWTKM